MLQELVDALGYVGSSLDKLGGREIRGALAGKPRELLSFVPFSDHLGITDERDITSGRDLLHQYGLVDKHTSGWGPGLAGFATEAALDLPSLLSGAGAVKGLARGTGAANKARLANLLHVEQDPSRLAAWAQARPNLQGLNRGNYVAAWGDNAPSVLKEEMSHGLTKMAVATGNSAGLSPQEKLSAHLYGSGIKKQSPLRVGLGEMMLESAGHSARGAGGEFWLSPQAHAGYHGQIGQYSPLAASLYHAAPGASAGAIGGGVAGAASDEDPVRGGLLGALAGAAGGGLLSHAAYKPRGVALAGSLGESGSLGLKYDHPALQTRPGSKMGWSSLDEVPTQEAVNPYTPEQFGLRRHDPEWVNNRTFYHGTGHPELRAADLDPSKTDPLALYGPGIYTSDENGLPGLPVTNGYATDRAGTHARSMFDQRIAPQSILAAIESGRMDMGDLAHAMENLGYSDVAKMILSGGNPRSIAARASSALGSLSSAPTSQFGPKLAPIYRPVVDALGGLPSPTPTIYQSQSQFGKILDLEHPNQALSQSLLEVINPGVLSEVGPSHYAKPGDAISAAREYAEPGQLAAFLKGEGYDALTHSGGTRTGNDYHQVVIGLDPNNKLGLGRPSPYQKWEKVPNLEQILRGESGAYRPDAAAFKGNPELSDLADRLGLRHGTSVGKLVEELGPEVVGMLAGYSDFSLPGNINAMRSRGMTDEISRAMSQVHPDSRAVGAGAEALAMRDPGGFITRVAGGNTLGREHTGVPSFRPNLPDFVLQPLRSNYYGDATPGTGRGLLVEHSPIVNPFTRDGDTYLNVRRRLSDAGMNGPRREIDDTNEALRNTVNEISDLMNREIESSYGGRWTGASGQGGDLTHNSSNLSYFFDPRGNVRVITHDAGAVRPPHGPSGFKDDTWIDRLASMVSPPSTGPMLSAGETGQLAELNASGKLSDALSAAAAKPISGQGWEPRGVALDRTMQAIELRRQLELLLSQYNRIAPPLRPYSPHGFSVSPQPQGASSILAALGGSDGWTV